MSALAPPGDASGLVVVLTGGSSGIGAAAARALVTLGAEVALVGRNAERTVRTAHDIGATPFLADYGRLADIRDLGRRLLERYPRIHVLANNAGAHLRRRELTVDGNERTLQESVLGGFLLTELLRPRLAETARSARPGSVRIIATASVANLAGRIRLSDLDLERGPWLGGWRAYCNAKLANIVLTRELARRLTGTGIGAYAFHPGLVRTRFGQESFLMSLAGRSPLGSGISAEQGADPLVRLIATPSPGAPSGSYFSRLRAGGPVSAQAKDPGFGRALWGAALERTGVTDRGRTGTAGGLNDVAV